MFVVSEDFKGRDGYVRQENGDRHGGAARDALSTRKPCVEVITAAVSYLKTRPDVDGDYVGVLGVCAAGGYAVTAAASEHRIKAIATASGLDITEQFRRRLAPPDKQ